MSKCQECEEVEAAHPDPRDPPHDTGDKVLCEGCYHTYMEDCIADAEEELRRLKRIKLKHPRFPPHVQKVVEEVEEIAAKAWGEPKPKARKP